jgi:hypothetical protein
LGLLHFNTGFRNSTSLGISYEVFIDASSPCNYLFLKLQLLILDGSLEIVIGIIFSFQKFELLRVSSLMAQIMMQLVKSSWILHLSCNKRRVAPIAALLSAILHPAIFPDLEMHQTSEKGPGPLKWVSCHILSLLLYIVVRLCCIGLVGLHHLFYKGVAGPLGLLPPLYAASPGAGPLGLQGRQPIRVSGGAASPRCCLH